MQPAARGWRWLPLRERRTRLQNCVLLAGERRVSDPVCGAQATDTARTASQPHTNSRSVRTLPCSICDCCDGTDEADGNMVCENSCAEANVIANAAAIEANKNRQGGLRIKAGYVAEATGEALAAQNSPALLAATPCSLSRADLSVTGWASSARIFRRQTSGAPPENQRQGRAGDVGRGTEDDAGEPGH